MDSWQQVQRQVAQAQRRLAAQQFLQWLPRCWSAALLVVVLLVLVDKVYPLGVTLGQWLTGALAAGLVGAVIATLLSRRSRLDAAVEIDRRFALKERISSSLALSAEQRDTPAGRALVDDATRRAAQLHVAERFGLQMDRWALLPLAPALLVFLVAVFVPQFGQSDSESTADAAVAKQVQESSEALRQKMIEQRKLAEERGLAEAQQLFEKLQRETQPLADGQQRDRQQALAKLNDLTRQMEERRQELTAGESLQQQLNQLKNIKQGPADKLAEALRNGDFGKAAEQLRQLREQLENSNLDKETQQKLAEQLADMERRLQEMAKAHREKQEELERKIAENRAAGRDEEANALEEQLAKLAQQNKQMSELEKLSEQVGQCSRCLQQGDKEGAAASLSDLESQLTQLESQQQEMEMLEDALNEISQCKNGMCQGLGQRPGRGNGLGRGQGEGARPEEEGDTASYDTRVKQQQGRGAAVVTGLAEGPNAKGQVQQQIQQDLEVGRSDQADPLTDQPLPRGFREHAREYFDALRDGQGE